MSPALLVVLLLFLLAYGAVGLFAARNRFLARLAMREAARRKWQSLLVIAGLMVGTATITGALIAADSVKESTINAFAYRNWGHVDLTVTAPNRFFPAAVADEVDEHADRSLVDGVAPGIELIGSASDLDSRQGTSGVTLVGFDPERQRPFGAFELVAGGSTYGADLRPGEVLVSRLLAESLDASVGDRLHLGLESGAHTDALPTEHAELTVAGIARSEGPGAYTLGAVVFAPLETARQVAGSGDLINVVRVSARGGIRDADAAARRAAPRLREIVGDLDAEMAGGAVLEVREAKIDEIANAETASEFIRAMLIGMSALVVAAGAALIVNLIGMLAEERRRRMGVLRALGLRRRRLVGLSVIEGAIYSLVAGVVGVGVGLLAGRVIATRFGEAFAAFAGDEFDFEFSFALKPATLLVGFAVGCFLTLLVVFLASRRTGRMSITAAIRDLPEPPAERSRHPWRRRVALGALALAGAAGVAGGVASQQPFPRLLGGLALIVVAQSLLRDRWSPRVHGTVVGLALAGWAFVNIAGEAPEDDVGTFFAVFVVAMLTAVFGLTILAAANLRIAETVVGALGRPFSALRVALRPPLAYLSRRPVRTGLTTGVFAVILGMLSLFAVFFVIFQPSYERFGNGYDVRVLSTGSADVDLPESVRGEVVRTAELATIGYLGRVRSEDGFSNAERALVPLFRVPRGVADDPPVRLDQRAPGYDTDAEVWEAVATDPGLVVSNFGAAGQKVTLVGDDGPVSFEVIGVQPFGLLDGMFGTSAAFRRFEGAPVGASLLLDLKPGVDAAETARRVEAGLFEQGVDADSVRRLLDDANRSNRAFFSTIDILMRMGLVIGVLALGIVALRIVTERRHVIGVLRAIGYRRRAVMSGLMAEAGVTVAIGAFVGVAVGLVMGWIFWNQQATDGPFGVDWAGLGSALGLVLGAVLLVTLGPAWRASRLPPAEAVRYSE